MTVHGLTKRQQEALAFIREYIRANDGVAPSYQEIADGLGIAKSAAFARVSALEERGHVRAIRGKSRSLSVAK